MYLMHGAATLEMAVICERAEIGPSAIFQEICGVTRVPFLIKSKPDTNHHHPITPAFRSFS
jgi:hypothetical protein